MAFRKKENKKENKVLAYLPFLPQEFAGPASLGGQADQGAWHSQTAVAKAHYTVQKQRQEVYEVQGRNWGVGLLCLSPMDPVTVGQRSKGQKAYISTITDHTASLFHKNCSFFHIQ